MELILLIAATISTADLAFSPSGLREKAHVWVNVQCEKDTVGQRIGYKVREGLRRSGAMQLVDKYGPGVQLSLICADPDAAEAGNISRYSYAITAYNVRGSYDYALTHAMAWCGTRRVDECAESLVADIDAEIMTLRKRIADGSIEIKN